MSKLLIGLTSFAKKCVIGAKNCVDERVILSADEAQIRSLLRTRKLLDDENLNRILINFLSKNISDIKTKPNESIINILKDNNLKKSFNTYLKTLQYPESENIYNKYKIITGKNMLIYLSDLALDKEVLQMELLQKIKDTPEGIPYSYSIYLYLYDKLNELAENDKDVYSTIFLTNKNSEEAEFYNEFLENIWTTERIKDFSSIKNNFNTFDIIQKSSASDTIVFSAFLDYNNTKNMNIVRHDKNFFNRKIFFKIFPSDVKYIESLITERDIYMELYKLVKYNVTPNILCKIVSAELFNFETNFVDKLNEPLKLKFKKQITSITAKLDLNSNYFKWDKTHIIMTQPGGTSFKDSFSGLTKKNKEKVLFQVLYTLYVFEKLEISHGDLHHGNIFIIEVPEMELCYLIDGEKYIFTTTYIVKIYDFDHSIICKDTNIKYNKKNVKIQNIDNNLRKSGNEGALNGETDIFNKNLDKIIFFLGFIGYENFSTLNFTILGNESFNPFFKRIFPSMNPDNPISREKIINSYTSLDTFSEPNRIYNKNIDDIDELSDYEIDPEIIGESWYTYFSETLAGSTNHIIKSNKRNNINHLWIPDNIILPTLDMLKDEYFKDLKSQPDEPFNIRKSIVYTIDNRIDDDYVLVAENDY